MAPEMETKHTKKIIAYCFSFRSLSAELLKRLLSADKKKERKMSEAESLMNYLRCRVCFLFILSFWIIIWLLEREKIVKLS